MMWILYGLSQDDKYRQKIEKKIRDLIDINKYYLIESIVV